jgi:hypothetical protein
LVDVTEMNTRSFHGYGVWVLHVVNILDPAAGKRQTCAIYDMQESGSVPKLSSYDA